MEHGKWHRERATTVAQAAVEQNVRLWREGPRRERKGIEPTNGKACSYYCFSLLPTCCSTSVCGAHSYLVPSVYCCLASFFCFLFISFLLVVHFALFSQFGPPLVQLGMHASCNVPWQPKAVQYSTVSCNITQQRPRVFSLFLFLFFRIDSFPKR